MFRWLGRLFGRREVKPTKTDVARGAARPDAAPGAAPSDRVATRSDLAPAGPQVAPPPPEPPRLPAERRLYQGLPAPGRLSQLGGRPRLPPDLTWPLGRDGRPLTHLLQLDLAALGAPPGQTLLTLFADLAAAPPACTSLLVETLGAERRPAPEGGQDLPTLPLAVSPAYAGAEAPGEIVRALDLPRRVADAHYALSRERHRIEVSLAHGEEDTPAANLVGEIGAMLELLERLPADHALSHEDRGAVVALLEIAARTVPGDDDADPDLLLARCHAESLPWFLTIAPEQAEGEWRRNPPPGEIDLTLFPEEPDGSTASETVALLRLGSVPALGLEWGPGGALVLGGPRADLARGAYDALRPLDLTHSALAHDP